MANNIAITDADGAQRLIETFEQPGTNAHRQVIHPYVYDAEITATSSGVTTASENYATGDVVGTTIALTNIARVEGGGGWIDYITIRDATDHALEVKAVLLTSNVSLGSDNSSPSISDANAQAIQAWVDIPAAYDMGGCRVAYYGNRIKFQCDSGSRNMYLGLIARATITPFTAGTGSLTFRVGVTQH